MATPFVERRKADLRITSLEEAVTLLNEERRAVFETLQAAVAGVKRVEERSADILAFWEGAKGGFYVLGVIGRLAKPIGAIAGAVAAIIATYYAVVSLFR